MAAMVLARLQAQDVDAGATSSSTSVALFVRCRQKALSPRNGSSKNNGVRLSALQLDVVEGDALWRGEVTEEHKPMVLDCSASEYLTTLESVFNTRSTASSARAFVYKWSRTSGVLTLMEESSSGFAMKYTSLTLAQVRDDDDEKQSAWQGMLQEVVDVGAHATQEMTRQRVRIEALEALLKEKDVVLETALQAKQQLEDQLFEGFCAVLNAKKDEIQRLEHELVVAQMQSQSGGGVGQSNGKKLSAAASKKARVTKAKGAKLKRKAVVDDGDDDEEEEQSSSGEEEAESHDDASDSQGGDDDDDSDSADNNTRSSRRAKRGAIGAYSQLQAEIRSSSQVCSADDVLSNLDAIIKQEDEANATIQDGADSKINGSSRAKRPRATAPPVRRAQERKKKPKSEGSSQEDLDEEKESQENKAKPAAPASPVRARPSAPAPARAIDSLEDDLFDIFD